MLAIDSSLVRLPNELKIGERDLALEHVGALVLGDSAILDRGFAAYERFARFVAQDRLFVCRCPAVGARHPPAEESVPSVVSFPQCPATGIHPAISGILRTCIQAQKRKLPCPQTTQNDAEQLPILCVICVICGRHPVKPFPCSAGVVSLTSLRFEASSHGPPPWSRAPDALGGQGECHGH